MENGETDTGQRAVRHLLGLPVHLRPGGPGALINLSATGVLVNVSKPSELGGTVAVAVPWRNQVLELVGRVVRCTAGPSAYHIAIEFTDHDAHTASTLRGLLRQANPSRA